MNLQCHYSNVILQGWIMQNLDEVLFLNGVLLEAVLQRPNKWQCLCMLLIVWNISPCCTINPPSLILCDYRMQDHIWPLHIAPHAVTFTVSWMWQYLKLFNLYLWWGVSTVSILGSFVKMSYLLTYCPINKYDTSNCREHYFHWT